MTTATLTPHFTFLWKTLAFLKRLPCLQPLAVVPHSPARSRSRSRFQFDFGLPPETSPPRARPPRPHYRRRGRRPAQTRSCGLGVLDVNSKVHPLLYGDDGHSSPMYQINATATATVDTISPCDSGQRLHPVHDNARRRLNTFFSHMPSPQSIHVR
ncbi:hypothetical protein BC826DRAFT_734539 [Russula brevipes]|nr:hypothetical protein BC826DRAFT_734539 [Russula brevipes]